MRLHCLMDIDQKLQLDGSNHPYQHIVTFECKLGWLQSPLKTPMMFFDTVDLDQESKIEKTYQYMLSQEFQDHIALCFGEKLDP